jgi:hypothetical protein
LKRLALLLAALLASAPALAHDVLLRATNAAAAATALHALGMMPATQADFSWQCVAGPGCPTGIDPYLQGQTAGIQYFFVIAGGGTGSLMAQTGTTTDQFGNVVPTYAAYDTGFWATCRFNGDLGKFKLPASIVAYRMDGLPLVATGGDGVTTLTDTLNRTAQTPVQPPDAVLLTAPGIM